MDTATQNNKVDSEIDVDRHLDFIKNKLSSKYGSSDAPDSVGTISNYGSIPWTGGKETTVSNELSRCVDRVWMSMSEMDRKWPDSCCRSANGARRDAYEEMANMCAALIIAMDKCMMEMRFENRYIPRE